MDLNRSDCKLDHLQEEVAVMPHISLQLTPEEQEEQTRPEETALTRFNDLDKPSPQFCKEIPSSNSVFNDIIKVIYYSYQFYIRSLCNFQECQSIQLPSSAGIYSKLSISNYYVKYKLRALSSVSKSLIQQLVIVIIGNLIQDYHNQH